MSLNLNTISSWASIISLLISVISLFLIGTIRANIIQFRRRKRVQKLIEDILRIPDDAIPISNATRSKFKSLSRNIPKGFFHIISRKSKVAHDIQAAIRADDIASVKEALEDYISYTENL